jgi:hypothetical protein
MRLLRLARVVKLVRGMKVRRPRRAERCLIEAARLLTLHRSSQPRLEHKRSVPRPPHPSFPRPLLQGIRSLFGTLIVSLPAFWNVGALLGLLFYIYAYIGGRGEGGGWTHWLLCRYAGGL